MSERGFVVSDLHLLSDRSNGEAYVLEILERLPQLEVLVLNGDTFDFAWTNRENLAQAVADAIDLINKLLAIPSKAHIYYLIGNHDCVLVFLEKLEVIAEQNERLIIHESHLQLGENIFLHGDICNQPMNRQQLRDSRKVFAMGKQRTGLEKWAYRNLVAQGLNRIVYLTQSKQKMVERIRYYMEREDPAAWKDAATIYFGHTHMPFRYVDKNGIEFINTGSALRGLHANYKEFVIN